MNTTLKQLGDKVDRLVREISIPGSAVTVAEVEAAKAAYDDALLAELAKPTTKPGVLAVMKRDAANANDFCLEAGSSAAECARRFDESREARATVERLAEVLQEARGKWIPHPRGPVTKRRDYLKTEFITRVDAALAAFRGERA